MALDAATPVRLSWLRFGDVPAASPQTEAIFAGRHAKNSAMCGISNACSRTSHRHLPLSVPSVMRLCAASRLCSRPATAN